MLFFSVYGIQFNKVYVGLVVKNISNLFENAKENAPGFDCDIDILKTGHMETPCWLALPALLSENPAKEPRFLFLFLLYLFLQNYQKNFIKI